MRHRALIVGTFPLWVWVIVAAALVSCLHSSWVWFRTGDWPLADELPPLKIYMAADAVEGWVKA